MGHTRCCLDPAQERNVNNFLSCTEPTINNLSIDESWIFRSMDSSIANRRVDVVVSPRVTFHCGHFQTDYKHNSK